MATKEDYEAFLATVKQQTGLTMLVPDDFGLVSLRIQDEYNTNIQFIEKTGKILVFVELVALPADAGKDVYRDLLAGCLFGVGTAGGYFSVEPQSETVIYNYLFDFDKVAAEPNEFITTLENIISLMDVWKERIRSKLSESEGEVMEPALPDNIMQMSRDYIIHG